MHRYSILLLLGMAASTLSACAPASSQISPQRLRLSALDAAREARTAAVSWAPDASLVYIEGEGLTPEGYVLPGGGAWRFIYGSPGRADQLVVTVTPKRLEETTRPRQSPPGHSPGGVVRDGAVLGGAGSSADWVDSPLVLSAVRSAGGSPILGMRDRSISLLLLPTRPPRWVVRIASGQESGEWSVDARTGQVVQ